MAPRPVWHLPGSPLTALLAGLPSEFEPRPLLAAAPPARADEDGVLSSTSGAKPRAPPRRPRCDCACPSSPSSSRERRMPHPSTCHAYLQKPVTPFVLANALRNACEHARLRREHEATRRQLVELNAIGVRLTAERDTDALLDLILTKAREITRSDAGSIYLVEESGSAPPTAPLQAGAERQRAGPVHRVLPAHQRREHRGLRRPDGRDRRRGRRLCRARGLPLPRQPRLRHPGRVPHQVHARRRDADPGGRGHRRAPAHQLQARLRAPVRLARGRAARGAAVLVELPGPRRFTRVPGRRRPRQ